MIWVILGFIASYIIGIIGWSIILTIDNNLKTYDELIKELCNFPTFIPIINIIFLIGLVAIIIIIWIAQFIYEYSGIEKLWNKVKDKKLPFKE